MAYEYTDQANGVGVPFNYTRGNPVPLDAWSLFMTYSSAYDYAKENAVAYPGQVLSVIENGNSKVYVIKQGTISEGTEDKSTRQLVELGSGSGGGGTSSAEIYWNNEGGIIIGNDTMVTFVNDTWTLITVTGAASKTSFGIGDRTDNAAKIEFGTGVTSIDASGFINNVNLREITLPATCTTIGANAFTGCVNLEKIDCTAWTTGAPILDSTDPFDGLSRGDIVIVVTTPEQQAAFVDAGWTDFVITVNEP